MNWSELNDELNRECFDAFKETIVMDGQSLEVVWQGEQETDNRYDDMPVVELKIEVQASDKHLFIKGNTLVYRGKTYTVFREAIQNPSNQTWEVELEP